MLLSWLTLGALGGIWGLTIPLTKIAVSSGHQQLGLIFWQAAIATILLGTVVMISGRRVGLNRARFLTCGVIALAGTILPGLCFYKASANLPAGVMAITISLVPMFAFPIALALGNERFQLMRFLGVLAGAAAIFLLLGPETALPDPTAAIFVLLAVASPLCYGVEANFVGKFGLAGLQPVETLFWASLMAVVTTAPLALATGQWVDLWTVWAAPEFALITISVMHAVAYVMYVWLVGRAGAVFSSQVAYLVTGFGVFWSMLLLGETYSGWIWSSLIVMLCGLSLVRPRKSVSL